MSNSALLGPLLSGAFAFIGVVLAQSVVIWAQKDKFEREDFRRFHSDKRRLYGDFLVRIRRSKMQVSRAIDDDDVTRLPDPHADEVDTELLVEEIRLIGTGATVEAALKVEASYLAFMLNVWKSAMDNGGDIIIDSEEIDEYEELIRNSEMEFIEVARRELLVAPQKLRVRSFSPPNLFGRLLMRSSRRGG
ncbi:hypothetical protein [Nocardia sp. NPDC050406]|uniref:hypothetical protein n=1 Tax=Nocardia sp. NPDC050406 TaxID=3364318 RepID=UPI0037B40EB8